MMTNTAANQQKPHGLSRKLRKHLFKTLLKCPHFDSHADLRSLFITDLVPWKNGLPQAKSRDSLVRQTIFYLYDKFTINGENALLLLLQNLGECAHPGDALGDELTALTEEFEAHLHGKPYLQKPPVPPTTAPSTAITHQNEPTEPKQPCATSTTGHETLTWLHLSDLHFRQADKAIYRTHVENARVVLKKLLQDIKKVIREENLQLDFIAFTGDVAFSAHEKEYRQASDTQDINCAADFFDLLLQATGLNKERLFIVPGNHDVNWQIVEEQAIFVKGCVETLTDRDAVTGFLLSEKNHAEAFSKFSPYTAFIRNYFKEVSSISPKDCFYVKTLPLSRNVAILGLNSAWMSAFVMNNGKAQDRLHLILGEKQVRDALSRAESADIRIALMHHPLDWLQDFDRRDVEALLFRDCDFILRGHQHSSDITQNLGPDGATTIIPAGACYHRRDYDSKEGEYNGYNFVRLDFSSGKGSIFWRHYDDRRSGRWTADTGLFDQAPQGKYDFGLPERLRKSLPHPKTIPIPAGEFWMGSEPNEALIFSNETPRRKLTLPNYAIGKYPVTNAEYHAFITATGYRAPEHWPRNSHPPGKENHPVVSVSLKDAQEYCQWLTKKVGVAYRLPTEKEWEKAARGASPETRRYPWAGEWNHAFANTEASGPGDTTQVDTYEHKNISPFGVVDMAGNVWEWTTTQYKAESYVIRGGSFRYNARFARNSCRGRCAPGQRDPDLGFRIVQILGE